MSVAAKGAMPWDLERFFYGNPHLTKTERSVAVLVIKAWDRDFRPVDSMIASQSLIGHWAGAWRSTVCRAVRKMVSLGYFHATWKTVRRHTRQGWKGVTRVYLTPGRELEKLISPGKTAGSDVSAGQARSVISSHTSRTHQASSLSVSGSVITERTDRKGDGPVDTAEFRRKTLAEWPRLAGSKPRSTPTPPPYAQRAQVLADAIRRGDELTGGNVDDMTDAERTELEAQRRQRARERLAAELAELEAAAARQRSQPRRKPPRSRR